jgi:hypothetical protein
MYFHLIALMGTVVIIAQAIIQINAGIISSAD